MVLALSSKVCASRLARASAAALSLASADSSCAAALIGSARHDATIANTIAFRSILRIGHLVRRGVVAAACSLRRERSLTVLRTGRYDAAARQRDRPDQPHRGLI